MFFTFPLLQAGTEIYRDSLSGTTIAANKTLSAKDEKYDVDDVASNTGVREQRVKNIVTLRLDHSAPGLSGNFDATVKFDIQYKDEFGETNNITGLSLSVSYRANGNDQYTDRRSYLFEGGHSVDITITEVSGSHTALKLENIIQVERLYNFDYSAPEDLTIDLSAVTGEYTISWKEKDNAEEYQLEWLHVNNYNGVDLPYDFSQNATRITTKGTTYKISSLFEKGFVLFRVRAVTYESLDRKYAIAGKWSCEDAGKCSGKNASLYIINQYVEITDDIRHTGDDLNWQYITNYAEEGKKKEVVTYYDGTMRPHQAVTRLNTDNNIIVGETYYDRHGRAAIQALPVPVVDPNEEKSLRFYTDFNKNVKGNAYGRDNFDKGTVPCELSAEEMQTTSGSSMYYSENNPDLTDPTQADFNRFIPQAEGYPFSQTEYTADNTGRIKRQGGVGADYQLGSNHETRYLYSTPNQDELNRLFGGEAGYSSHYKKNTVIDANGQLSVSYIDMYGRVVATALTGSPATGLSGLPSYYAAKDTVVNILNNPPAAGEGSFSIRNTYFHTVTTAAPQKFDYILPDIHFDSEGNLTTDICLDCVYDLTIDIVDECGKRPELTDGEGKLPITRTVGALNYVCGESKPLEDIEFSFTTERLEIGTYAISRTLTVNKGALEANTTRYVDSISGIRKLKEIIDAEKAKVDLDACKKPNCEENCLLSLGENATYEEFMRCKVDCEYISECSILEDILASDFMPGIKMEGEEQFGKYTEDGKEQVMGGQYALYKIEDGKYVAGDNHSVFTTANMDRVYTKFGNFFTDRNGGPIEKYDIKALVENFDLKWAKKLALEYHPEKCKLETCKANEENGSLKYDYLMSITETYEEAYNLGLLNPLGLSGAGLPPATEAQKDPFFKSGGLGYASRSQMEEYMLNDIISASNILDTDLTVSVWRKAVLMSGVCKEFAKDELIDGELTDEEKLYVASNLNSCLNAMNSYVLAPLQNTETEICSRDRVWTFFRALYRAKKEQIKTGLPSPQGCTTVDSKKRKRFPENTDLFSPDELEVINSNGSDMAQINKLKGNAESEMKKMCEVQAFAQVDKIMNELTECKIISSGLVWDDTNEDYKKIKKAFTDIMIYTCDMTNIFGSSDIPADLIAAKPDSVKYISFDAALKDILGEENINMDCNADLISFPKKSGHEYTELVAYKLLDSCGCARLLEADEEYRSKKARNLLPLSVTTGRKYFEEEYGFSIDNYQAKICLCTNEMLNPVNINERLAQYGEFIPRGISCETCVDCDMIKEKLQQFKMRHPFLPAIYINVFYLVAQDQIRNVSQQRMIENYLNGELNLNKNYGEYYTFLNGCYRLEEETDGYVCDEMPDIRAGRLINIIETVTKEPVTEQCIIPEMNPDVRTVFPELADNSCKNYLYDVSASEDTTLIISIYDPKNSVSSACPVKLRFVDNLRDYSYNNILHFNKNSIRTAPETDPDNNNLFLIDATIDYGGKMITATLRIEACFPVFICYDSEHKGGYTLCPRPQATHKAPEDDCAESLILAAMKNAERIYETILDSTITAFRTDYSLQCLTTTGRERLDMSFKANERHYTLYYYDQAGNLVRTIPPEGVVPIAVSLFDKINEDRDNDTMTVFTKHRMETRYLYNSLNQLTYQYMPDHDAFEDISLTGKNSGLPGNLNIEAMAFTGAEGVLFGTTPSSNGQSAGYVTYNGGESWEPITDLGINNLNGLCKIPGTGAICIVGDKGTLLKSSGSTRTTVNTQVRENIVSVNFTSGSNGYFFTESGKVYRTVNGGDAWTFASNIGVSKLEHVRFISATTGYAVGRAGNEGAVYVTTNGGLNWLREQAVVSNMTNIRAVNDQTAYASDERGILLKITSTGSGWETRPVVSSTHLNIMKMQFTADGKAVALTTDGYLQVSLDGGASWNAPNGAEDQEYLDMALTEGRAYLLRDDNKIFRRSSFNNFNTQADVTPGDLSGSLKTIYFESINAGYVAGEDGLIYYTADGGEEWTRLIPDDQFGEKEIIALYSNPSGISPVVHVVTSDKKLYRGDVRIQMNENNVEFSQVPLDGAEVKSSAFNPSGKGYVLTTDDKIYTNAGNGGGTWENTTSIAGLTSISLSPDNPLNAFAVGADGKIIPTKDAFADNIAPQNISLPSLNGAAARGATAVAVGNSGTLIRRNSSAQWEIMPVPFTENLRRVVVPAADKLIVASTGGFLYTNEDPGSGLWTQYLPALTTSMINELTYAGATLFAGCSDGKIYRKNGGLMESFDLGPYSVNAILQDGSTAWAVGDKGTLLRLDNFTSGTDWVARGRRLPPNGLHPHARYPEADTWRQPSTVS